ANQQESGFIASWPQFGAPAGFFLASLAVLFFGWFSGDQFLVWGWRIPFLISIIMVVIGLWIRLGILEMPVLSEGDRRGTRRTRSGPGGAEAPAERGGADRAAAHAGAGAGIYLRRFRLYLRNHRPRRLAQFPVDCDAHRPRSWISLGPGFRTSVGPHRP